MTLRNVNFDFKITKGDTYSRYSKGKKAAVIAIHALDPDDDDYMTKANEILDDFFCDLLGEDYDQKLGVDPDDFDDLLTLLEDFNDAAQPQSMKRLAALEPDAPAALPPVSSSIQTPAPAAIPLPMNRAKRRAARRAAHRKPDRA
nr:MAG TPA_asm: hypothetical protein [Caudoviricetes sp.]